MKEIKKGSIVYFYQEYIENGINYGNKTIRGKVTFIDKDKGIVFVKGDMNMTDCYMLDKVWGSLDNVPQIKLKIKELI